VSHWTEGKADLGQSVLELLRNHAREVGEDPQVIQLRYATERLMYRISLSGYADQFVLKGAWLFFLWGEPQRATRDVDLAGRFDRSPETVERIFADIVEIAVDVDDGLTFDKKSLRIIPAQEGGEYGGYDVRVLARLGRSRLRVKIDLGFGDRLIGAPTRAELPAILDLPSPWMRVYSKEAVVAEKLEAIVKLGRITTRFKDFFDILTLSRESAFEGSELQEQVEATFAHRGTNLPVAIPQGLQEEFGEDAESQAQWNAFRLRTNVRDGPREFKDALARVREFTFPVLRSSAAGERFTRSWRPGEGWI